MPPTRANGKICYIEMPATDIARSAAFYGKVFGWNLRKRVDGHTAFDDGVGEVSGTWVLGRPPSTTPGPRPRHPSAPACRAPALPG
ncbi:MAG TPA: VOC family protein [Candidatus Angelobacter sp.]|nr:VOC family protein [Candidatus Angelobacter sp.]